MKDAGAGEPNFRSEIYHFLAEALSDPPDWLSRPGPAWPLYELASRASGQSGAAMECLPAFARIPAGNHADRKMRYRTMMTGNGSSVPIPMYESLFRSGRIAGPEMFAVERIYREHGLHELSNELPDHASLELAFLAHLVAMDTRAGCRRTRERAFIKNHAGDWLKSVGHQMAISGDPVYGPIGRFLESWLQEAENWETKRNAKSAPVLSDPAGCILCGFCARVCPTGTLVVRESDVYTRLVRTAAACTGCGKCVRHCETGALAMVAFGRDTGEGHHYKVLLKSPRVRCACCEVSTISTAEFHYMVSVIGPQAWLDLCQDCRARKEVAG